MLIFVMFKCQHFGLKCTHHDDITDKFHHCTTWNKKKSCCTTPKASFMGILFFVRTFIFCIMCGRICQLTMSQKSLAYFYIANPHIIMNKNSSILWQNKPFFIGFIESMMILEIFLFIRNKKMYIIDIFTHISAFLYGSSLKKTQFILIFFSKTLFSKWY